MYIKDSTLCCSSNEDKDMDEDEVKTLIDFFQGEEVKIVWKEEETVGKPKVGHGKIHNFDGTFVFLIGEKGRLALNRKDITAIKQ